MVFTTCVIAVGTLVSAGAIVLQWREMVGGGTQTDKIVNAANGIKTAQSQLVLDNKQALADNRQALSEVLQENREEVAGALKQNREALKAQTNAANRELAAVQNQTEASERPWIATDVSIGGPLVFDANGVSVTIRVATRNVGNSVATNVVQEPELTLSLSGRDAIDKVCQKAITARTIDPAGTDSLIPGQHWDQSITLPSGEAELDKVWAQIPKTPKGSHPNSGFVPLQVTLCAAYGSNFNRSVYETGSSYWISLRGGLFGLTGKQGESIPPEGLQIIVNPSAPIRVK